MEKDDLGKKLYFLSHLDGEFVLRSGEKSGEYFDKYKFEEDPSILNEVAWYLSSSIPARTELLAGLEMGGNNLATALSFQTGIHTRFVRKHAKEYGTQNIVEGGPVDGKQVCIVEDVVTTGGQIIESVGVLRALGAKVEDVVCVILRDRRVIENLSQHGLRLQWLFTMDEIKP